MRKVISQLGIAVLCVAAASCMQQSKKTDQKSATTDQPMKNGKNGKSIKDWEEITKKEPTNSSAFFHLGDAYYNNKKYEEAEVSLKKSLNLDPKNTDALFVLGDMYVEMGRYDEADAMYRKIQELNPDYPGLNEAMHRLKMYKKGIPQDYAAAQKAMKAKKWDEALMHWEALAKSDPQNTEYFYWIGDVYVKKGELGKAEQNLKQSLKLDPQNPDSLYLLAIVYENMGRLDEALGMAKKLVKVDPKYPGADKLVKCLEKKIQTS